MGSKVYLEDPIKYLWCRYFCYNSSRVWTLMSGAKEVHMTSVPILHSLQTAKKTQCFLDSGQKWVKRYSCLDILTLPVPIPDKEKINLNFYFRTSLWYLKRFYEDLKDLHKGLWGTTKNCENKNLSLIFYFNINFLNAQDGNG